MSKMENPARLRGIVAVRADANDPKQVFTDLQKSFEAFKAANNERLDALGKGQEDIVKAAEVEKINAELGRLQGIFDAQAQTIAGLQLGGAGAAPGRPVDAEYSKAFLAYFRKDRIEAALTKGNDESGGYLTPREWDRKIIDQLVEQSPMRDIADVQSISGAGHTTLYDMGGMGSGWVGETAPRPETSTPLLKPVSIPMGEIYANPAATQQMLDDAEIDLEQWMANKVEQTFAAQESIAFVAGDGVNKPRGFLTYAAGASGAAVHPAGPIAVVQAAAATQITHDELLTLIYSTPSTIAQNGRFVMNRNTIGSVRKLKDTTGAYIWQPSAQQGQPSTLQGYPVTELSAMPSPAANALTVAFGDFKKGYQIVDRMGIRVLRDAYSNKPYVTFYTTKRVGGGCIDPTALRILKQAAA